MALPVRFTHLPKILPVEPGANGRTNGFARSIPLCQNHKVVELLRNIWKRNPNTAITWKKTSERQ